MLVTNLQLRKSCDQAVAPYSGQCRPQKPAHTFDYKVLLGLFQLLLSLKLQSTFASRDFTAVWQLDCPTSLIPGQKAFYRQQVHHFESS